MRYQVIVPSSAFGEPVSISSIAYAPVQGLGEQVNFDSFAIDMGYASVDQLGPVFETNYVSGSKMRVFERTSSVSFDAVFPWTTIQLDTPFLYDPAEGNLIYEIHWPKGSAQFYSYDYPTSGISIVKGAYGSASGEPFSQAPHLLFDVSGEAFEQMTFAGIKATFN